PRVRPRSGDGSSGGWLGDLVGLSRVHRGRTRAPSRKVVLEREEAWLLFGRGVNDGWRRSLCSVAGATTGLEVPLANRPSWLQWRCFLLARRESRFAGLGTS